MLSATEMSLRNLQGQHARVQSQIGWAKFSLEAPTHFVNESLQTLRRERLANLLKELAELTKVISTLEFQLLEEKTQLERAETKAILSAMGTRYQFDNKVFYLLP